MHVFFIAGSRKSRVSEVSVGECVVYADLRSLTAGVLMGRRLWRVPCVQFGQAITDYACRASLCQRRNVVCMRRRGTGERRHFEPWKDRVAGAFNCVYHIVIDSMCACISAVISTL